MDRIFRPSQATKNREEDGRVLYLPPPPKSRGGSASPGGRSRSRGPGIPGGPPPRGGKRLIVAADGESILYLRSKLWTGFSHILRESKESKMQSN